MRLLPAACIALLLLTGCSDDGPNARPSPSSSPSAAPSASAPADAYQALQPPTSPGVGSFDAVAANHAYSLVHGLLALQLLEPATLTGHNQQELTAQLRGSNEDPAVAAAVGAGPTARGLDYRPLFPATVLATPPAEVVRSSYTADEVQGRGGEQALRISWSGALRYHITGSKTAPSVAYALSIAYVFRAIPNEPGGVELAQVIRGTSHAAPVLASCVAKGVLVPTGGAPTEADFGAGPYSPVPSGARCPL